MTTLFRMLVFSAIVAATPLVVGCGGQSGSSAKEDVKLYDVKGTVVALDREKKVVTLDHEDIPGLMKAMKMEFDVADAKVLDGMAAGDRVAGKLKTDAGKYVVTSLAKQ